MFQNLLVWSDRLFEKLQGLIVAWTQGNKGALNRIVNYLKIIYHQIDSEKYIFYLFALASGKKISYFHNFGFLWNMKIWNLDNSLLEQCKFTYLVR